jgi:hypothetical protein
MNMSVNLIIFMQCYNIEKGQHDDVCQFKYLCILGTKSNDIGHPDYVPSINMGYSSESDRCIGM